MKKRTGISVLAASVLLGIYLTCFWGNPTRYSQCMADNDQLSSITQARTRTEDLLDALIFDEETLFYDNKNKTFYYSLVEGNASACNPRVELCSSKADLQITFLTNGISADGIKNNQTIDLRSTAWSEEKIDDILEEYKADIYHSGAYLRDMERWPDGLYTDASDELNSFRAYIRQRLQECDAYYFWKIYLFRHQLVKWHICATLPFIFSHPHFTANHFNTNLASYYHYQILATQQRNVYRISIFIISKRTL